MSYRIFIEKQLLLNGIARGLSRLELAETFQCSEEKIKASLRHHGLRMPRRTNLAKGDKFGRLEVVRMLPVQPGRETAPYRCRCECGRIITVNRGNLTSGNTTSCGCKHKRRGKDSPLFTGYEEITGHYWNTLQRIARKAGRRFSVTMKEAWDLYLKQQRCCALSGLPIGFAISCRHDKQTASLDRIDSKKGYVPGNVQWVHKDINFMKRHHDQAYFIDLCQRVAQLADV